MLLRVLWSLDLSHRKTRPRRPQGSEKAQQAFKKGGLAARLTEIAQAHPEVKRFEIWSQDEARVGQKGPAMSGGSAAIPRADARYRLPVGLDHRGRMSGPRHRCRLGNDPARHRCDEPVPF